MTEEPGHGPKTHEQHMAYIRDARQKRLSGQPYEIPPAPGKTRIQSIITALPVIMLVIGLIVFFRNEAEQADAQPIIGEAIEIQARYKGVSTITEDRRYLWVIADGEERGIRITAEQKAGLVDYEVNDPLRIRAAPSVSGSSTLWLLGISTDE